MFAAPHGSRCPAPGSTLSEGCRGRTRPRVSAAAAPAPADRWPLRIGVKRGRSVPRTRRRAGRACDALLPSFLSEMAPRQKQGIQSVKARGLPVLLVFGNPSCGVIRGISGRLQGRATALHLAPAGAGQPGGGQPGGQREEDSREQDSWEQDSREEDSRAPSSAPSVPAAHPAELRIGLQGSQGFGSPPATLAGIGPGSRLLYQLRS